MPARPLPLLAAFSVAATTLFAATTGNAAPSSASSVESRILSLVNQGRSSKGRPALRMHGGLRSAARSHSAQMARAKRLGHQGFPARVNRALGVNSVTACENVARFRGEGDPATQLYQSWVRSGSHNRCMNDASRKGFNAAGLGVVLDSSGMWWATLEAAKVS